MTDTASPLSSVDAKALAHLAELLAETEATWATEQQWRAWCDRVELVKQHQFEDMIDADGKPVLDHQGRPRKQPVDLRARGFTIPKMLEAGLLDQTSAVFHAPRNGVSQPPLALYRPA